jgi:hypothetical protein
MAAMVRTIRMTGAESFWYVLGCIGFGAAYFAKIPVKKALSEMAAPGPGPAAASVFGMPSVPQPQVSAGYEPARGPGDRPLEAAPSMPAGPRHGRPPGAR